MAAKLIRQPDQLVLVGAPTSAAAAAAGTEKGPAALRETGILDKLQSVGYHVTDVGDLPAQLFQPDAENPRARNVKSILAMLDPLRTRIEQAARAHALPLVLGGDSTILVALVAGLRRQAPSLGLVHVSRYADLHTPMQTEDGLIGPMTVSHLVGQGAAELVRFWKSPPLVREPDLVAFGLDETDSIDLSRLENVAVRDFTASRIRSLGVKPAAEAALEQIRGADRDFVVHLSWDVFSSQEVPGCGRGAAGGLTLGEVGEALDVFAVREKFAGLSISGYNPELDPERRGAAAMAELIVATLAARHTALLHPPEENHEENPEEKTEEKSEEKTEEKAEVKTEVKTEEAEEKSASVGTAAGGAAAGESPSDKS